MKFWVAYLIPIIVFLQSCCSDCGEFIPPNPKPPCSKVYVPVSLSNKARTLLPFVNTDSMVFRHRLGGKVIYRLDSISYDSAHYGCDTLLAQENLWLRFATETKLPAQPSLVFRVFRINKSDRNSAEVFSIETGVDLNTMVFVDDFTPVSRDYKSNFHSKVINCDTAFSNIYDLSAYKIGYGGYRNIYYSKEKGIEALIGGPNSFDYFIRQF